MSLWTAFADELEKIAATRSVKEWRRLQAKGDTEGAAQVARASGDLGLKPRYLEDISSGGEEAGVDKMMGRVRSPSGEVNESGVLARKLYKPDSSITRGEFTGKLLDQKQRVTDAARGLSPEARNMVPAMYGHQTTGQGPLQRSTSFHEYVPGVHELLENDKVTPATSRNLQSVRKNVLQPMQARGMTLMDTISHEGGVNYGNVVGSASGPKVLDFLPSIQGESEHAVHSLMHYAPEGSSQFGQGRLGDLRKEVFKPQMAIHPASPQAQAAAMMAFGGHAPSPPGGASGAPTGVHAMATPQAGGPVPQSALPTPRPGALAAPGSAHPLAPTQPSAGHTGPLAFAKTEAAPARGALSGVVRRAEGAAMKTQPLGRLAKTIPGAPVSQALRAFHL